MNAGEETSEHFMESLNETTNQSIQIGGSFPWTLLVLVGSLAALFVGYLLFDAWIVSRRMRRFRSRKRDPREP
jgi:hypothetical protein